MIFMLQTNFVLNKELSNFHKPLPIWPSLIISRENKRCEWSLQNEAKISVLLIDSCKNIGFLSWL